MSAKGTIAAGDRATAEAGAEVLRAGGNAFDAVLAAFFASTVAEPVLSSLGGGGFLLARPHGAAQKSKPVLYDFFVQTPHTNRGEADFYPVIADFGTVQQEFHIGQGAIATPGAVRGMFDVHRDLGSMPMAEIVQPAVKLARDGFPLSPLQGYIFDVVKPIYLGTESCRAIYTSPTDASRLIGAGETMRNRDLADFLDVLAREGDDLFYRGEVAQRIARDCEDRGGHLDRADFEAYGVHKRQPLTVDFQGVRLFTNPPPSTGGILIAFALALLDGTDVAGLGFGSKAYLQRLAHVMDLTNQARVECGLGEDPVKAADSLLDPELIARYRADILGQPKAHRGTTHISVIDKNGNAAALTLSNGEGSGYVAPGTGVVLNNMLGEEDINPLGWGRWQPNVRMSSMMAPSIMLYPDGREVALGSGGSNRIRTAILQVLLNLVAFGMEVEDAVARPRIHFEGGLLNIEPGFVEADVEVLTQAFENAHIWDDINMFFGGVHAAQFTPRTGALIGGGDPRRGGVVISV